MNTSAETPARVPLISVVMGSSSDWETMQHAVTVLLDFGVQHEVQVVSAHRMPDAMFRFAETAAGRGVRAIIAGAGGAAHLPGMLASKTIVPVYGVPVPSKYLRGLDSLYSIVQMPKGVPVATFAIGAAGAVRLDRMEVLAATRHDPALRDRLTRAQAELSAAIHDAVDKAKADGMLDPRVDTKAFSFLLEVIPLGTGLSEVYGSHLPDDDKWKELLLRILVALMPPDAQKP